MAIDFTGAGHIGRATSLPSGVSGGWCFSLWYRPAAIGSGWLTILDMSGGVDDIIYNNSGALRYYGRHGTACDMAGFFDAADVWYHIFGWWDHETGGNHEIHLYGRKISASSYTSDSASSGNENTPTAFKIGNDHYGDAQNGEIAHVKVWSNASAVPLTAAQLQAEGQTSRPLHSLADLIYFNPLYKYGENYLADLSGTADLSLQGSGTGMATADGPPISWGAGNQLGLAAAAAAVRPPTLSLMGVG